MLTSAIVTAPKLVPEMPTPVVFPTVRPLTTFVPAPPTPLRVMPLPAPLVIFVMVPFPEFIAGKGVLPEGGVKPVRADRVEVESWPINLWPFSKVMPLL